MYELPVGSSVTAFSQDHSPAGHLTYVRTGCLTWIAAAIPAAGSRHRCYSVPTTSAWRRACRLAGCPQRLHLVQQTFLAKSPSNLGHHPDCFSATRGPARRATARRPASEARDAAHALSIRSMRMRTRREEPRACARAERGAHARLHRQPAPASASRRPRARHAQGVLYRTGCCEWRSCAVAAPGSRRTHNTHEQPSKHAKRAQGRGPRAEMEPVAGTTCYSYAEARPATLRRAPFFVVWRAASLAYTPCSEATRCRLPLSAPAPRRVARASAPLLPLALPATHERRSSSTGGAA